MLLALLTGCAGQPSFEEAPQDWQSRSDQLAALSHWTASGKVALRRADAAESANLRWQQRGEEAQLKLSGPLGVGATTATTRGDLLRIERGDTPLEIDTTSPEQMIRHFGWNLPLASLPFWLKGLPSPHFPIEQQHWDETQPRLQHLQQDGWMIHYEQYGAFEQYQLPTRIRVLRDDTRVKLILKRWQDFDE